MVKGIRAERNKQFYEELPKFAEERIGFDSVSIMEEFAKKKKIAEHRVASIFWDLVDEGKILTETTGEGWDEIRRITGVA